MTWPEWFPVDCPPSSAVPADGSYYRLVENDPVKESDFTAWREEVIKGWRRRSWSAAKEAHAAACSVFADLEDVEDVQKATGGTRALKMIALGDITGSGEMEHSPSKTHSSHYSWWRPVEDTAWSGFAVQS